MHTYCFFLYPDGTGKFLHLQLAGELWRGSSAIWSLGEVSCFCSSRIPWDMNSSSCLPLWNFKRIVSYDEQEKPLSWITIQKYFQVPSDVRQLLINYYLRNLSVSPFSILLDLYLQFWTPKKAWFFFLEVVPCYQRPLYLGDMWVIPGRGHK